MMWVCPTCVFNRSALLEPLAIHLYFIQRFLYKFELLQQTTSFNISTSLLAYETDKHGK